MKGTIGHLAPEWILRINTDQFEERRFKFFPIWAANASIEGGDVLSLSDHKLEKNVDVEEIFHNKGVLVIVIGV
ncbi:hypothetical protein CsSME_00019581 [Camellia sinensis var. sinensis]